MPVRQDPTCLSCGIKLKGCTRRLYERLTLLFGDIFCVECDDVKNWKVLKEIERSEGVRKLVTIPRRVV